MTKQLKSSAGSSNTIFKLMLVFTFVLNFVLAGGMIYILALIRSLQMIIHWPLLRVVFPANIQMIFGIIIPFIMFDIIDPAVFEGFLTFDPEA